MRLVDDVAEPRLMTVRAHHDHTDRMRRYTKKTVARLTIVEPVRIRVQKRFPQLRDPARSSVFPRWPSPGNRERTVCRCVPTHVSLDSHRGRRTTPGPGPSGKLYRTRVRPITGGKCSTQASPVGAWWRFIRPTNISYWPTASAITGSLVDSVANAKQSSTRELARTYGHLFMEALAVKTTIRKHVNVLQHLAGHFKGALSDAVRDELHAVIGDYQKGFVPLSVPVTFDQTLRPGAGRPVPEGPGVSCTSSQGTHVAKPRLIFRSYGTRTSVEDRFFPSPPL